MGFFDFLMRTIAGRAEARADLVNVGAHGTLRDLPDLLPLLPPRDSFGEAAGEAALRILARASRAELAAYAAHAPRWNVSAHDVEHSLDPGTIALAALHGDEAVVAIARTQLQRTDGELARTLLELTAAPPVGDHSPTQ